MHALTSIIRNEGVMAVYNGLSAGLLLTRMSNVEFRGDSAPSFAMKVSLGMAAGAAGSVVGNPAELALIRMTSKSREELIITTVMTVFEHHSLSNISSTMRCI
uniref:Mitochondrial substrate carrier family protein n=1 Tax=Angiostrongylus cantonensis TaxID=6313 RepID=A0A0K0DEX9_ANGCA